MAQFRRHLDPNRILTLSYDQPRGVMSLQLTDCRKKKPIEIQFPGYLLIEYLAEFVRENRITELRQMEPNEVLGIPRNEMRLKP